MTIRGSIEEKLEWAFKIYDINGNGYINQSEIISIVNAIQRMTGRKDNRVSKTNVLKLFNEMDKNKDSRLSLEEFINGSRKDESFLYLLQTSTDV